MFVHNSRWCHAPGLLSHHHPGVQGNDTVPSVDIPLCNTALIDDVHLVGAKEERGSETSILC